MLFKAKEKFIQSGIFRKKGQLVEMDEHEANRFSRFIEEYTPEKKVEAPVKEEKAEPVAKKKATKKKSSK